MLRWPKTYAYGYHLLLASIRKNMTITKTNLRTLVQIGGLALFLILSVFATVGIAHAALTRQLEIGDSGADVSSLQTFLAQDPTIYPQGLVTGYFGTLTKAAVSNFQAKNGIATVGRVGPVTLAAINAQMSGGGSVGGDVTAPTIWAITPAVGRNSASIQWNTNEQAAGIVYYGTTWPSLSDSPTDVTIGGTSAMTDTMLRVTQNVSISGLQPNTTYYYVLYARDASGNVQVTWPSSFKTTN